MSWRHIERRSMPLPLWPEQDQRAWQEVIRPKSIFDLHAKASADWSPARRRIVQMGYGYWLLWLHEEGVLDPPSQPATGQRTNSYLRSCTICDSGSPYSVVMLVGGLKRMLDMIAPMTDWNWLRPLYCNLKRMAVPTKEKHTRIVPSKVLLEFGLRLFDEAEQLPIDRHSTAVQARDGLVIAMLATRPVRIGNFEAIEIGGHLTQNSGLYRLTFAPEETKVGRSIDFHFPDILAPYITRYLEFYRPRLLQRTKVPTRRLWISAGRGPVIPGTLYFQLRRRTRAAFGQPINPHLFRDCVATSIAIEDPAHVRIAAVILGHSRLSTTEKHYNQAQMLTAARTRNSEITR